MSLNYENVGKNVIYNRSVDDIEDYVKGTIVGCYIGEDEEYYVTSIESSGQCIKVYDDSLIEIIESGGSSTDSNAVHYTADSNKTDEEKAQARTNIGALGQGDLGTVFTFKGSVATINDLPSSNNSIGDVWFVESELANFVWLEDELNPNGFWDEFGQPIDLSAYEEKPTINTVSGTSVSISPVNNNIYNCGEITSLTISNPPATGKYSIVFFSGATPTTTVGIENFVAEANKRYKITVEDNYATYDSWPYTPTP